MRACIFNGLFHLGYEYRTVAWQGSLAKTKVNLEILKRQVSFIYLIVGKIIILLLE